MVEYNIIYDQIKNLRISEGTRQKTITISNMARKRGQKLINEMKRIMPKDRNDWDFSFLVEFLITLMDSNINGFKSKIEQLEARE